jgi:hypothetical protein
VLQMMDRTGLTRIIGPGNIHATVLGAVVSYLHEREDGLPLIMGMFGEALDGVRDDLRLLDAASTHPRSKSTLRAVARAFAGLRGALRRPPRA